MILSSAIARITFETSVLKLLKLSKSFVHWITLVTDGVTDH